MGVFGGFKTVNNQGGREVYSMFQGAIAEQNHNLAEINEWIEDTIVNLRPYEGYTEIENIHDRLKEIKKQVEELSWKMNDTSKSLKN